MEEDLPEDIIENGEGSENVDDNDIIENGKGFKNVDNNNIIKNREGFENVDNNDIIKNGEGSENVDNNNSLCYDCDDFKDTDSNHIIYKKFNYGLDHLEAVENNKENKFPDFENEGITNYCIGEKINNRVEIIQDKASKPTQMFNIFRSTEDSTQTNDKLSTMALSSSSQSLAYLEK
ncbi:hypothetical protein F8M41_013916 [Gigaspora margarita]|uniref:Uncharacterized protein n=1 Tax=Gigaspora margarita TaxID=4874 RepID=A0A8H4A119_GIGMA|nr:hypothetical protein F8M41_013916 [Gigaspora margarita]